jgi:hypothetical protein
MLPALLCAKGPCSPSCLPSSRRPFAALSRPTLAPLDMLQTLHLVLLSTAALGAVLLPRQEGLDAWYVARPAKHVKILIGRQLQRLRGRSNSCVWLPSIRDQRLSWSPSARSSKRRPVRLPMPVLLGGLHHADRSVSRLFFLSKADTQAQVLGSQVHLRADGPRHCIRQGGASRWPVSAVAHLAGRYADPSARGSPTSQPPAPSLSVAVLPA